jgi:hypothetical protein
MERIKAATLTLAKPLWPGRMTAPDSVPESGFRRTSVKFILTGALLAAAFAVNAPLAFAQMSADDLAWINRCISDNKRGGATAEVVRKYCICMNEEMDDNERLSISAWERKNPEAMKKCDKESGWN